MKKWLIVIFIFGCISSYSQEQTVGLFVNNEESLNGYTLFTNNTTTYLIDNCGFEVHSWESSLRPGLAVYLLEDGSILRCNRISGNFGGGGAGGHFERASWDGNVIWQSDFSDQEKQSHHDIAPLPNGNFLTLAWTPFTAEQAVAAGRLYNSDMWIEKIYEIKMVGTNEIEIVWEWSMADHLVQDMFADKPNYGVVADSPGKMDFNYLPASDGLDADWAHFNAIAYNEELDQIAVSSRDFSEIWLLDHSTTTEEARTSEGGNSGKGGDILYRYGNPQVYGRGTEDDQVLFNQHNIEWVPKGYPNEGSLSVFNNNWMQSLSRVERWTPPVDGFNYELLDGEPYGPATADWSYDATGFFSSRISGIQFLSNGNALVCSGGKGRFFELNEDKEIVWEYINPIRSSFEPITQGETPVQNAVFRALRYEPDYPAFDGKDLTPRAPLELEPLDSDCVITSTIDEFALDLSDIKILNTLVQDRLEILTKLSLKIRISSISGQSKVYDLSRGLNEIDMSNFQKGMYFISTLDTTLKIVKI